MLQSTAKNNLRVNIEAEGQAISKRSLQKEPDATLWWDACYINFEETRLSVSLSQNKSKFNRLLNSNDCDD